MRDTRNKAYLMFNEDNSVEGFVRASFYSGFLKDSDGEHVIFLTNNDLIFTLKCLVSNKTECMNKI